MHKDNTRGVLKNIFGQSNKEIKLEIINNESYMEWLIKFTERFHAWRDDMGTYYGLSITNDDKKNMERLRYFFEIVNNYAYENGIKNYRYDKEVYYLVKINDYALRIGKINGVDFCYYCQKEMANDKGFIDFGRIKFQKDNETISENNYSKELGQLENLMMDLYKKNVPVGIIEETTKKVLKRIKNK